MNAIVRAGLQFSRAHRRLWLLWVCPRAVVFARLHANILREVTSYLAQFQMLTHLTDLNRFSVLVVNVYRRSAVQLSVCDPRLAEGPSIIAIDYMKFVFTGGASIASGPPSGSTSAFLWSDGEVSRLSDMIEMHSTHTLVYVERIHTLFVLGGHGLNYKPLTSCEKYTFASDSWTQLPKMASARLFPQVSQFRDFLYVCSTFGSSAVDRLDIRTNEWTQFCFYDNRIRTDFFLFAGGNSLLLLGKDVGKQFDFATRSWKATPPLGLSSCGAVNSVKVDQLAFVLIEDCFCACIDLASGLRKQELDFQVA